MFRRTQGERQRRFEEIAMPHLDTLYRTALYMTGRREPAEDLVQDTYLAAYAAFDRFDGRYPRAWLLTILRHTRISQLRHAGQAPLLLEMDGDTEAEEWPDLVSDSVEGEVLADILPEALERAVAALPEAWRIAVVLADVEGLSYQEIAQVMDCPIGTVMSRLYRGRRRLEVLLRRQREAHCA